VRFGAGSVLATLISQVVLTVCYGVLGAPAVICTLAAFVAGAVPNYLLSRAWAWGGRSAVSKHTVGSYLVVIAVTNALASLATWLTDGWVRTHVASHGTRTALVDLAYLASYGAMFVAKFLVCDRVVFSERRSRHQVRSTTRA
jgi:putative flippase GtrA